MLAFGFTDVWCEMTALGSSEDRSGLDQNQSIGLLVTLSIGEDQIACDFASHELY